MAKGKNQSPTLMDNYTKMKDLINNAESDVIKRAEKNNSSAGQRFRKVLKEVKELCGVLRKQSLEKK